MIDLISRKYAIAHLKQRLYETQLNNDTEHPYYEEISDNRIDVWMNEVPSVQPEQKHGKWIRLSNYLAQCSVCKDYIDNAISCGYNYCPNCGAIMDTERE